MELTPDELARMMRHAQADAHRNSAAVVREMAAGCAGNSRYAQEMMIDMHEAAAKRLEAM